MRYIIEIQNGKNTTFKYAYTLNEAKNLTLGVSNARIFDKIKMGYVS